MRRKVYNNEPHPDTATSLSSIGAVYDDIGNTEKALDFYNQSLNMYKMVYNNEPHPNIASSLNNIGAVYVYWNIGNTEKALDVF